MPENKLSEAFFYELAARVSDRMMRELPEEKMLPRMIVFSPEFEYRMNALLSSS